MSELIQSLWVGDRLGVMEKMAIQSFLRSGHQYHLYTYADIKVPPGAVRRDAREIFPEADVFAYGPSAKTGAGSVSAFSNYFRYKLLYDRGGYWVDSDVVCLKPFAFDSAHVFGQERTRVGDFYVASCVMKAPAGSEAMKFCLESCMAKERDALKWGEIGPTLVTEAVRRHALVSCVQPPEAFCPVNWWAVDQYLVGSRGNEVNLSDSHAVHLWNEMWRRNGFDKNARHHPDSLYERLRVAGVKLV
jgi:hypothetical protein